MMNQTRSTVEASRRWDLTAAVIRRLVMDVPVIVVADGAGQPPPDRLAVYAVKVRQVAWRGDERPDMAGEIRRYYDVVGGVGAPITLATRDIPLETVSAGAEFAALLGAGIDPPHAVRITIVARWPPGASREPLLISSLVYGPVPNVQP